jgi:AAA15 family ATPase/GTPase
MLRKFRVSNFKSFEKDVELDLTNVNGYEFNSGSIKNGVVNNAIIYGHNGVGKSNLALALFDIIEHLTDHQRMEGIYKNYLNAYGNTDVANFYFEFFINDTIVCYEYKKLDYKTIEFERFEIGGVEYVIFDRSVDKHATIKFEGAENLKSDIDNKELSILKYIRNNTSLLANEANKTFADFFKFVEQMLYFRSLLDKNYFGFTIGTKYILESIVQKGNTQDFELFLNESGIECKLAETEEFGVKTIAFNINNKLLPFYEVASTGTAAMSMFYLWYQDMKENSLVSFLFIDEFDAFYHHSLSTFIVKKLKETGVQFILTTHNTSNMSNELLRPDCYFEMTKTSILSFSKSTQKELRVAHNIEKMYKAGSFNVE